MISTEKRQEYLSTFNQKHPDYWTTYRENIQEKSKEYRDKYYLENKDKFLNKITCDVCGKNMFKQNLKRHQKAKFCQTVVAMKQLQTLENLELVVVVESSSDS